VATGQRSLLLAAYLLLSSCSGSGEPDADSGSPPPPPQSPSPAGLWQVFAVTNVQTEGLFTLPIGSRFSISNGTLDWISVGGSGPLWHADPVSRVSAWQHSLDYYENDFADFPVDYRYGWESLGAGGDGSAAQESFYELSHTADGMTLRYTFVAYESFRRVGFLMCQYRLGRLAGLHAETETGDTDNDAIVSNLRRRP
jgi:hypothetical protein